MEEQIQQPPVSPDVSPLQTQTPVPEYASNGSQVENQFATTQALSTAETPSNQEGLASTTENVSHTTPETKDDFSIVKEIVLKKLDQQEAEIKNIREALLHEGFIDAHKLVQAAENSEQDFKISGKQWNERNLGNPNPTIATEQDANLKSALSSLQPNDQTGKQSA